jgi:hypothetical protein
LTLAACGGGTAAPTVDAGVDAGFVIAPPAPPVLTPCPTGWREVTNASGLVTCDPWPATGYRTDCAWDEAHFAGTPGCARVGTACPADGWPADLPADRTIVYVDDDAAPGGDGSSHTSAFNRIGDAVIAAPNGAVIAVASGLYDEVVRLAAGMTIWGACVSGTRIVTRASSQTEAALTFTGDGSSARNLGIDGCERGAMMASGASGVSVDSLVVTGVRGFGLLQNGGSVSVSDLVVRRTREQASDLLYGRGLHAGQGAHLTLARAMVEDNREAGIFLTDADTHVEASDVVVRGTRQQVSDDRWGRGIALALGAHLTIIRSLLDDNRDLGLSLTSGGTSVDATDVVVRGTREQVTDGSFGRGINVEPGAHLALTRALIEDNREVGLFVVGTGTTVEANDIVVRGTRERAIDSSFGRGVAIQAGALVTLSRTVVEDNRSGGIGVFDVGTSVDASDVVVRGTRERASDGTFGRGIEAQSGPRLVLARASIEDNRDSGFLLTGAGTSGAVTDVVVRGTREQVSDGKLGFGLYVEAGAHLSLTHGLIEDNREAGVFITGVGTSVEATDLAVHDTLPRATVEWFGAGVFADEGARVLLVGAHIERSRWVGIGSVNGASVEVQDLVVRGVEPCRCPFDVCVGESGGFGLVAGFGGTIIATRFTIEGATLCGVLVVGRDAATPSALDLQSGVIDVSMVGACVQQDGYDTTRLQNDVEYRDVGVPLRATSYEIPSTLTP